MAIFLMLASSLSRLASGRIIEDKDDMIRLRRYERTLTVRAPAKAGGHASERSAGRAEGPVELLGEIGDWLTPRLLTPSGEAEDGGALAALQLSLPAGVYAYKLRVNGAWTLDLENPRTRSQSGMRNNVLSLGGAPEPVLFAPAPPFVREAEGGGVELFAGLRRGHGDRLLLRWTEEGSSAEPARSERRTPLTLAGEEDEHLFFHALLPVSSERTRVRFELANGAVVGPEDEPGAAFVVERARGRADAPAWWKDAVVYAIFVDRFRPADDLTPWGADPGPDRPAGGHLDGIRRSLGELADLGINTLYLTPIHIGASCHRYDQVDPLRVDPALGGEAAFERLLADAHARGMRVLVDLALTHAGRGMPAYEDVRARGAASRYAGWFQWTSGAAPELIHYGSRRDAPLFDLRCPDVQALALQTVEAWARRGVDGLRLDAAAEVPMELARAIRARLRAIRPEAVLLGEVVPLHAWRWRAEEALDAATDFGFQSLLTDFILHRAVDAAEARRRLTALDRERGAPASLSLRFVSTHDHPRFATLARLAGAPLRGSLGLLMLLTSPGVPALLYGEEVGLAAETVTLEPENVWPDRAPMPWRREARDERTRALVKRLLHWRARSPALARGDCEVLHAEGGLLVYRRSDGGEVFDVVINASGEPVELTIEDDDRPGIELLVPVGEAAVTGPLIALGAAAGVLLRRTREGRSAARRRLEIAGNSRVRDEDFAASALTTRAMPARIDLAITERCNLQCRHCITFAPERTLEGAARALSPRLLERRREPLAVAAYVGFVHGGEPLSAPIFWDVLRVIGDARGSNPTVVHVLTNGVLLTERTAGRLIDAGARSISVSLDGASAAVNDAIRAGGRFEQILSNVRAAVRLRRSSGADLRLGVSFVILRQNLAEVVAMVELCAALGLDWLKLEEAVPATPFAARSLLNPGSDEVRDAVLRAALRGRELGLVVVDHTAPPAVWRCKLDQQPEARAFLAGDEHANRSEIHPCRVPWEHACIDPNGDVRMGDFFAPVLGSIADARLTELWNGPAAQAQRLRSIGSRLCGQGPVTCAPLPAAPGHPERA